MRSFHPREMRKRGWIPMQMVQRLGSKQCTWQGKDSHSRLSQPCLSWKSPEMSRPAAGWRLPVFSDVASRGHQDCCTASPVEWQPLVLDSDPGPFGRRAHISTLTHPNGVHQMGEGPRQLSPGRWDSQGYTRVGKRNLGPPQIEHIRKGGTWT